MILAKNEIIPAQFADTLAAKLDIINQGAWKSNPQDTAQGISAVYDYDRNFDPLPVLRIDYDVDSSKPAFNGYSIKLNKQGVNFVEFHLNGDCAGCMQCAIICPDCCIEVYK